MSKRLGIYELLGYGETLDLGHAVNYLEGGDGGGEGGGSGGEGGGSGGEGGEGGEGGGGAAPDFSKMTMDDFKGILGEDQRENGIWDKYESPKDLGKGILELQALASKKGDIPTDWEDAEAVNAFWGKLGKPENKDDYDFAMPENFEFGDPNYLTKIAEAAHEAGMPKSMLAKFMGPMMEYEAGRAKDIAGDQASVKTAAQARMSEAWGDSTEDMLAEVDNILGHFKVNEKDMAAIKNDTGTMLLLGKVANLLGERGQAGATFGKTKAGLDAQMGELNDRITTKLKENGRNLQDPTLQPLYEKRDRLQDRLNA